MNANPDYASFAKLVESLRPWLDQVVIIGGWAHRLYRLHPLVQRPRYEPLATLDADVALPGDSGLPEMKFIGGLQRTDLNRSFSDSIGLRLPTIA